MNLRNSFIAIFGLVLGILFTADAFAVCSESQTRTAFSSGQSTQMKASIVTPDFGSEKHDEGKGRTKSHSCLCCHLAHNFSIPDEKKRPSLAAFVGLLHWVRAASVSSSSFIQGLKRPPRYIS